MFLCRHVGDLGNVTAKGGVAEVEIQDSLISLSGPHCIIGRTMVVSGLGFEFGRGDWIHSDINDSPLRSPAGAREEG